MLPLVVRIDADDTRSAEQLKLDGWREEDVLVSYSRENPRRMPSPNVRRARADECESVAALATRTFHPKNKTEWVREAFARDDRVVYVEESTDGSVAGFLIVRYDKNNLVIDLIGSAVRKSGTGRRMVETVEWLSGYRYTRAGTQENNIVARQFYAALGFNMKRYRRTFYK